MKKTIIFTIILLGSVISNAQYNYGGSRTSIIIQGHNGFVIQPPISRPDGSKPWLWFAPTNTSYPNSNNSWILSQLVAKGFWIIGLDVGETYGSLVGVNLYNTFIDSVMELHSLNPKGCLFAQSRGGLLLYNWAWENNNASYVSRIAGIYPVGNLSSYPGIALSASAYSTTIDFMTSKYDSLSPMGKLQKLYEHNVPIYHIHGDADYLVPMDQNSQILHDRYTALGGDFTLEVVEGQGHAEIPQYFQSQNLLDFIFKDTIPEKVETGIENRLEERLIYLSPNPSRQDTFLHYKSGLLGADVQVSDMSGSIIYNTKGGAEDRVQIPTTGLPQGVYFVKVIKGEFVNVVKLVVN